MFFNGIFDVEQWIKEDPEDYKNFLEYCEEWYEIMENEFEL